MTRMKVNWCGTSVPMEFSFTIIRTIVVFSGFISCLAMLEEFFFPGSATVSEMFSIDIYELTGSEPGSGIGDMFFFISILPPILFSIYYIIVLGKTRWFVRRRYSIPQRCPGEDYVCSIACSFCAITQMARHTANYGMYKSHLFTRTGLPRNTPLDPLVLITADPRTMTSPPIIPQEISHAAHNSKFPVAVV
mmetsp:Transcript_35019/g.80968  ORF Transcript_35019/g.80968 Transcript_35019/m.80968 type:complete len:192 (-) Transcript_35019:20-595(-)